jgi:hypothetical protein
VLSLILVSSAACQLLAQSRQGSPPPSVARFVGSWNAEFKGVRYVGLDIRNTQLISGEIKTGRVNADENGNISEVIEEAVESKNLIDPKVVDAKLVFKTKEADGELIEYEMSIVEPGKASLRIAGMPIKPFSLTKAK